MFIVTQYDPDYTIRKRGTQMMLTRAPQSFDECALPPHEKTETVKHKYKFAYQKQQKTSPYIAAQLEYTQQINDHKDTVAKYIPVQTNKLSVNYEHAKRLNIDKLIDLYFTKTKDFIFSVTISRRSYFYNPSQN